MEDQFTVPLIFVALAVVIVKFSPSQIVPSFPASAIGSGMIVTVVETPGVLVAQGLSGSPTIVKVMVPCSLGEDV